MEGSQKRGRQAGDATARGSAGEACGSPRPAQTLLCSWKPKSWPRTKGHRLRVWVGRSTCLASSDQGSTFPNRPPVTSQINLTSSRNDFPQPASPYGSLSLRIRKDSLEEMT